MKPEIIFFGSDNYSAPVLNQLYGDKRFKISAIVTSGSPSPLEEQAKILYEIKFASFRRLEEEFLNRLRQLKPDVGVLASFGKILPQEILKIPRHGILNIHPSLLPKYRGPSPGQMAIFNGEKVTGVTIFKMDEKVDHGPILSQFKEEIRPDDTAESLYLRLFSAGAKVLTTILPAYLGDRIELREQDDSQATYTQKLTRKDGFIPPEFLRAAMNGKETKKKWRVSFGDYPLDPKPYILALFIRAMSPWPGAWTEVKLKVRRLKILKAHQEKERLILDQVQLEGKKPVTWKQFQEGYPEGRIDT